MFTTILSQDAQNALAVLGKSGIVSKGYLAGGSALALHFGHRHSEDLDFFSLHSFDPRKMSVQLEKLGKFIPSFAEGISLIGVFGGVKFSYFQYNYPLLFSTVIMFDVSVVDPKDIAAMKIAAVMDRGTKRDFVDLYELVEQGVSMEEMFKFYNQKYNALESNIVSILRSLRYFDDAEKGDMPDMIRIISWGDIKQFFISESLRLAKKYLEE